VVANGAGGAVISGQAEAGSTVSIFDNGKAVGSATANASGAWSFTTSAAGSGVHSFTEAALDAAGNAGDAPGAALYSAKANQTLTGGAGADVLIGRGGDTLTGGAGPDHFVFNGPFGKQTVTDFTPGATTAGDQIWIDHAVVADFAHLLALARQAGADVTITVDKADVLTLHNVGLSALHSGDFFFF
jgi:Ca2+-binding RTX toxin-like protein